MSTPPSDPLPPPDPAPDEAPPAPHGEDAAVEAQVTHAGRWSSVWLVPLAAFVIGLWMVYAHHLSQGPLIEIRFENADGIEPDKTKVRTKNVEIGEVLGMRLSEDAQSVVLSVRMHKESERLLHGDSKFWIVRPRVSPLGVTGLGTLLSGAYIELEPGSSEELARLFEGLDNPPETPAGTPGLHLLLESDSSKQLRPGTPIMFGGITAGKIEHVDFDAARRRILYSVFIVAPHDRLITENTRFWFNSGVAADISADGVRLEFETLETIATGGISFGVPEGEPLGSLITEDDTVFEVYAHEDDIYERIYRHSLDFIILAEKSVRGLQPGSPVEYRGVKVGEVVRTDINYDDETILLLEPSARIPILIKIEPARLGYKDTDADTTVAEKRLHELIGSGLRGEIKTTNYVTGAKLIDLQYLSQHSGRTSTFAGYTVIPTAEGQADQLLALLQTTAQKVNALPLAEITTDTLETLAKAQDTLDRYQQLAEDYSTGSEPHHEILRNLRSLERILTEVTPLVQQLRRQPNSIIIGPRDIPDIEPVGVEE